MNDKINISPYWVTGFFDGEGCFSLYVRRDKQKRKNHFAIYYRWQADFAITLREDDIEVLKKFEKYFNAGAVSFTKLKKLKEDLLNKCTYHIVSTKDLVKKVIPHFEKYPLKSKKAADFILWKEAVKIIHQAKLRKKHLADKVTYSEAENKKLLEILEALKKRLTGGHLLYQKRNINLQGTKNIEIISNLP